MSSFFSGEALFSRVFALLFGLRDPRALFFPFFLFFSSSSAFMRATSCRVIRPYRLPIFRGTLGCSGAGGGGVGVLAASSRILSCCVVYGIFFLLRFITKNKTKNIATTFLFFFPFSNLFDALNIFFS